MIAQTMKSRAADVIIWILLLALTLSCLFPLLNMVAISLSDNAAASANLVGLFPVNFTWSSYEKLLSDSQFWRSFLISVERVVLGLGVNMALMILMAYPLSKSSKQFRGQKVYMNIVIFAMLFSGGLIPTFMVVKQLGLLDSIWALILPGAVPIGNVILLMNAFRAVPKSLEEAAKMDGASQWKILFSVYLPVVLPTLATVMLFTIVGHWNDYFSALVYINKTSNYPLQTYIQQLSVEVQNITDPAKLAEYAKISDRALNSAKIVISTLPLLLIYPFLQKYFVSGIVVGSVKE
ncbi:carbohydrate ABC transporter permease [Paenibacillus melissococcoides]|uniref:Carbohydrate ABC transporter permease n=1 Tax=Paenibacillus melissococcoides TaxID=2912268 RepID=A0ABN8TZD2_9BACL|nr:MULTISPECIES: carbohydrate ABC transporter permease [Paenibacillus]MEB9893693.1 carbohydrate ABC transporter permease [Bacillus cereus]CAH8244162.1 carbohydrate ABC transporter permease [Paenibacillus melissococcoides]CAH8703745.1 carbohydrate ABC transporter permease [Paenibacillus melissococcoides]CAH8706272.1 carbohydrate ABC transporter permease [Paenibacillus melissococcoides]GIO77780.1 putative ABC transporter permease protein YtcP [Paenibacillus dendritiformis]